MVITPTYLMALGGAFGAAFATYNYFLSRGTPFFGGTIL